VFILVHAADVQDRDGAVNVLKAICFRFPWLRHVFADGGSAGDKLKDALKGHGNWTLEINKRSDTAKGFVLSAPALASCAWPSCSERPGWKALACAPCKVGARNYGSVKSILYNRLDGQSVRRPGDIEDDGPASPHSNIRGSDYYH
jgi:hypothetical protein